MNSYIASYCNSIWHCYIASYLANIASYNNIAIAMYGLSARLRCK